MFTAKEALAVTCSMNSSPCYFLSSHSSLQSCSPQRYYFALKACCCHFLDNLISSCIFMAYFKSFRGLNHSIYHLTHVFTCDATDWLRQILFYLIIDFYFKMTSDQICQLLQLPLLVIYGGCLNCGGLVLYLIGECVHSYFLRWQPSLNDGPLYCKYFMTFYFFKLAKLKR